MNAYSNCIVANTAAGNDNVSNCSHPPDLDNASTLAKSVGVEVVVRSHNLVVPKVGVHDIELTAPSVVEDDGRV